VTIGAEGIYTLLFLPNGSLEPPAHSGSSKTEKSCSLSPSLTIGDPQASSFDSLINPREFEPPNCIGE